MGCTGEVACVQAQPRTVLPTVSNLQMRAWSELSRWMFRLDQMMESRSRHITSGLQNLGDVGIPKALHFSSVIRG